MNQKADSLIQRSAMEPGVRDPTVSFEHQVRHLRHPLKKGPITIAGDEDCDIPELTATFLFGGTQIEQPIVPDRN